MTPMPPRVTRRRPKVMVKRIQKTLIFCLIYANFLHTNRFFFTKSSVYLHISQVMLSVGCCNSLFFFTIVLTHYMRQLSCMYSILPEHLHGLMNLSEGSSFGNPSIKQILHTFIFLSLPLLLLWIVGGAVKFTLIRVDANEGLCLFCFSAIPFSFVENV